jgi:hypothetical protein
MDWLGRATAKPSILAQADAAMNEVNANATTKVLMVVFLSDEKRL